MHIAKNKIITFASIAGLSLSLTAKDSVAEAITLPGITITATSLSGEETDASRVGSSVSVVTAKDIERQQIKHVSDVLRNLPGVSVSRTGSFAGTTQIRMRGAEGNHVLVIVDGIEMNTGTEGEFDFSNLSAENIERVEVIRGPQSGLYGSNALAGVISITTKKGKGPLTATLKGEAGSFNTKSGNLHISGGTEKVHGSLSIDRLKTDGFNIAVDGSERDGAERTSYRFKGGIKPTKNLDLSFVVNKVEKKGDRDTDNNFDGLQEDNPTTRFTTDILTLGFQGNLKTFDGRWTHKFNANSQQTDTKDFSSFPTDIESETIKLSYVNTLKLDAKSLYASTHFISSLVEYEEQNFKQFGGESRGRTQNSYALQYRGEFNNQLYISASVRHDNNDAFEDTTTYKVSGAWKVPQTNIRLHSNVGTGVVNPALFEQFGSFSSFVPNAALRPEESFGWDLGVEWTSPNRKHVFDITYFNQDLESEIAFNPNFIFGGTEPTLINLDGTSKRQGIEVSWKGQISNNFSLNAAYTYLDSKDANGVIEIRRPKHSGKINANYLFHDGKGNLNLGVNYNGDNKDLNFGAFPAALVTLDDYVLVSLAGSYKIQQNVELFGRVENLLDEDYQEVFGFETPGVSAYAGIKIKLGPNE